MSIVDNHAAGAGLAALALQQSIFQLLILHKVFPKAIVLEFVDISQQHLENLQMGADASGISVLKPQFQPARFQIELLVAQLRQIPD